MANANRTYKVALIILPKGMKSSKKESNKVGIQLIDFNPMSRSFQIKNFSPKSRIYKRLYTVLYYNFDTYIIHKRGYL